jgi:hypothetical protein
VKLILPPDPFWPLRVVVTTDGDPVPFHLLLAWRWQFEVRPMTQAPA